MDLNVEQGKIPSQLGWENMLCEGKTPDEHLYIAKFLLLKYTFLRKIMYIHFY